MTKISPPPWTMDEFGYIFDSRGRMIFVSLSEKGDRVLAVGAPDLQAALRELVARIEEVAPGTVHMMLEPEMTGARAALARSEGQP